LSQYNKQQQSIIISAIIKSPMKLRPVEVGNTNANISCGGIAAEYRGRRRTTIPQIEGSMQA
jgi:hypothetical protein